MESKSTRGYLVINLLLALGLIGFIARDALDRPAEAQPVTNQISSGPIQVVGVQLGRDSYGVVMVDTAAERMWVYEVSSRATAYQRLRLLAARSWQYDKLLDDYNTAEPRPSQVKEMLEKLSQRQQSQEEDNLRELFEIGGLEAEKVKRNRKLR